MRRGRIRATIENVIIPVCVVGTFAVGTLWLIEVIEKIHAGGAAFQISVGLGLMSLFYVAGAWMVFDLLRDYRRRSQ